MRHRRTADRFRSLIAGLAVATIVACQAPPPDIEPEPQASPLDTVKFAPDLGVDLATFRRTKNGAAYGDLKVGNGSTANVDQTVTVRYVLYLANGTPIQPQPATISFAIQSIGSSDVIRGWVEGIPGMKVGGLRKLVVPPALGYGANQRNAIPPNSTLVFEIELLAVR
jgi:FKBP-type peptidyl-prolyl cis-trans isomerase FkpA